MNEETYKWVGCISLHCRDLCQFYKWESYYVLTEHSAEVDCKGLGTI